MKNAILTIGTFLFAINGLLGLLLSGYEGFNLAFTSIEIVITTFLLYLLFTLKLKDGYTPSLGFMIIILGIIGYIIGLISHNEIQDNGCVIAAIILLAIESITIAICHIISKSIE